MTWQAIWRSGIGLLWGTVAALALAGCGTGPSGESAAGFLNDSVARAFIPLTRVHYVIMGNSGAAVVIAPGIAATNAHLTDVLGKQPVIGRSRNYDLMYFRTPRVATLPTAAPVVGERVIAYGTDVYGALRMAQGVVRGLNMPVEARCGTCIIQGAFTYDADAGPGFSGGPVIDLKTGNLVGITFGFTDAAGRRTMYAYPMSRVHNELAAVSGQVPADPN